MPPASMGPRRWRKWRRRVAASVLVLKFAYSLDRVRSELQNQESTLENIYLLVS